MRPEQFIYKDLTIGYSVYGNGQKSMLAFHGFNQSTSTFSNLFNQNKFSDFTIYSIGLFHHESQFPDKRLPKEPLTVNELSEIIYFFCQSKSINTYSLFGYSIGARICLALLSTNSDKIENVILLAPDGLKMKFWYNFLLHTWIGNLIFKESQNYIMSSMKLSKLLYHFKFISKTEFKIVEKVMENPEIVRKVWLTWNTYKNIYPNPKFWIDSLNSNQVDSLFIFGKYDKVISQKSIKKLQGILKDLNKIHVLNTGHNFLNPQIIEKIVELV